MMTTIIPIWILAVAYIFCLIFLAGKDGKSIIKVTIVFLLLFLVNIRFKTNETPTENLENNLDVLFVIDNSISMLAEDYDGNTPRIDAVKKDCIELIKEFTGAKFGLVLYHDVGRIYCPFTTDVTMVKDAIQNIAFPERMYASGSSLNSAIEPTIALLQNYHEDERQKIIIFVSDGEITNGEQLQSFSEIHRYIDDGIVLGYGTLQGGKMKVKDSLSWRGEASYLKDGTSSKTVDAISKIDETNLKKIASDIGVPYEHREENFSFNHFVKEIQSKTNYTPTQEQSETYRDTYYLFAILLLGYLWIRCIIDKMKMER